MWQRIQTLFLLIAILLNGLLFMTDLAVFVGDEHWQNPFTLRGVFVDGTQDVVYSTGILMSMVVLSMLLSLVVILMYKKRQLQIKLSQLNLFLQAMLVASIFYFTEDALSVFQNVENIHIEYGIGTYLGLIPMIFIYLAIRSIKKDEALVRAADRIR